MTVGFASNEFYLLDNWPGEVTNGNNPSDWTAENVAEIFPVGTKRMIYDDTGNGWATLIFMQFQKGTAAVAAIGSICSMFIAGVATAGQWFQVTNTNDEGAVIGPLCVALGTMTDAYYGWFWCGGVCPVDTIPGLDITYPSDGSVGACVPMKLLAASSLNTFETLTTSTVQVTSAFSLVADANQS
jgi:hypothetical protein